MGLTTSLSLSSVQFLLDQSGISSLISDLLNKSTSTQTWPDRGVSEEGTRKLKQISPVRTCLHPMRTPSRMDQLGDLWTPLLLGDFLSRPWSKPCPTGVSQLPDGHHHQDQHQAQHDGLEPQSHPLLHHAVALLLCPLLCGQSPERQAQMS